MKTKYLLALCLIPILIIADRSDCDTKNLFTKLIDVSNQSKITTSDFLTCELIVDTLDKYDCMYYEKDEALITSLTFLFGKICYEVNTDSSIKAFLDYHIKHIGFAEKEQISFLLKNLFPSRRNLHLMKS